jgi:hypothetical protein
MRDDAPRQPDRDTQPAPVHGEADEYGVSPEILDQIRENLRLTPAQRLDRGEQRRRHFLFMQNAERIRRTAL